MSAYGRVFNKMGRVANRALKKMNPRGLILMYHRVSPEDTDPWSLRVNPEHFQEHLEVLHKHTQPVSLRQLADVHKQGKLEHKMAVITFDDGYANNLYQAKPLLESLEIPATVFASSYYIRSGQEYWWDALERILLQPGKLPPSLELHFGSRTRRWDLKEAAELSKEEAWENRNSPALYAKPGTRLAFYYSVWETFRDLSRETQAASLEKIRSWASFDAPGTRESHRPMTPEELRTLEKGGLVEVGGHTVNHEVLSELSLDRQKEELVLCKQELESMTGHLVETFSYPYGDYLPETVSLTEEAGYYAACTTRKETIWKKSDILQSPRFEVQNWNGREFENHLLQWINR